MLELLLMTAFKDENLPGWKSLAVNPVRTALRSYYPSALIDGKIYIYAGYDALGMQAYDIATNTWVTGLPTGPTQGYKNGGCGLGGSFYVVEEGQLKLWKYTPGGTWSYIAIPSGVGVRKNPVVVGLNGKLYVFGGGVATLWSYDPDTDTWLQLASGPTDRVEAATFIHGNNFYMVGGTSSINTTGGKNETWRYSVDGNVWTKVADFPVAICQARGDVIDDVFYSYGGYYPYGNYFAKYDILLNKWTEITDPALRPFSIRGNCAHTYAGAIYWYEGYSSGAMWRFIP